MSHALIFLSLGLLFGAAGMGHWPHALPSAAAGTDAHGSEQVDAASPSRDAIAATVIEAMRTRFDGADVEFRFAAFQSEQGSLRDLSLSGAGQVRLVGGDAWLPIRYSALFDQYTGEIRRRDRVARWRCRADLSASGHASIPTDGRAWGRSPIPATPNNRASERKIGAWLMRRDYGVERWRDYPGARVDDA